jgi:hypothetical protein
LRVYYVYTPCPKSVSSWAARVKNYGPKNSYDRGAQLEVVMRHVGQALE